MLKQIGVMTVATLSALLAGGGVMRLGAQTLAPPASERSILKATDGHYWATGDVDGTSVRFLVDTGSSQVALTAADAQRLGVDLDHLVYDRPVFTAGGHQNAAQVMLEHVDVAGARVDHVNALVMKSGLATSLLGMTYLGRLSRIEATPQALEFVR